MITYLTDLGLSNNVSHENVQEFLSPKGILYVVMNRPEVHNAFNSEQIVLLTQALENAESNPEVKVVVLCGEGINFCAGGDINYMQNMGQNSFEENKEDALQLAHLMHTLNEFPKPTIARVNGAAYGGGVGLVCCCDMAFGTEDTTICLSEVKIGMVPATIAPYVMNTVGLRNTHRLMLTADVMQGQEAVRYQFLNDIFPVIEFNEKVDAIATKITTNAPNALEITKSLLLNLAHQPIDESVIDYTADVIANVRESDEGKEGLTSFLEKRKPSWSTQNSK